MTTFKQEYLSPEYAIARIDDWIERNGGEDSTTLILCEAKRTIQKMVEGQSAIEQAVLQSEQVQAWKRDAERLDWLADPNNSIGNVQLPTECVTENLHSLRAAIDAAMEKQP
ncbi:MAG: hypothetical protein WCZ87_02400 [Thiohalobacteraceae bacterium]